MRTAALLCSVLLVLGPAACGPGGSDTSETPSSGSGDAVVPSATDENERSGVVLVRRDGS